MHTRQSTLAFFCRVAREGSRAGERRGAEGFSQIGRQKSSKCHEAKRFPHFPLSFQPQSISAERRCTQGGVGEGGQATCASAAAPVPRQGKARRGVGGGRAGVRVNARHAICSTAACRVQLTDFLAGTRPNSLKMGHSMQKLSLCVFVCVCVCNC